MAFRLGNFSIDEILEAVAENFEGEILYSLDQLQSASIEITSESTDIVDKKGNVVRTIYRSKQGSFTATNAFLVSSKSVMLTTLAAVAAAVEHTPMPKPNFSGATVILAQVPSSLRNFDVPEVAPGSGTKPLE